MKQTENRILGLIAALILLVGMTMPAIAGCPECEEVAKGKIPAKFLDKSLKELPSGIAVWDVKEAMPALKDKKTKLVWADTRPGSFLKIGTVKKAVHMLYDQKGKVIPDSDKANALTKESLMQAMKKIDPDVKNVKVVFFCQGPKCHRSYNAALHAVSEIGLDPSQVIWFRGGYPNLEKHINKNPKLKKRISRYLKGDVVNS